MILLWLTVIALAPSDSLLSALQKKIDDSEGRMKSEVYSFVTTTLSKHLDEQGRVKDIDTTITWRLRRGYQTLADSVIYSSTKPSGSKKKMSQDMPRLGDTSYIYELQEGPVLCFRPKRLKKGDLSYRLGYKAGTLHPQWLEIAMPQPKLPVRDFLMRIDWTSWEGMLVPERMWMRAEWKMLLISGRMEVETKYSDYRLQR